jgi:hypothetical protein
VINSVEVTRLRGIREGKLDELTPLVVLVGPNACGKSTILDALLIGGYREAAAGIRPAVKRHKGVAYGLPWLLWKKGFDGPAEIKITTSGDFTREYMLSPRSLEDPPDRCRIDCDVTDDNPDRSTRFEVRFHPEGMEKIYPESVENPFPEDFHLVCQKDSDSRLLSPLPEDFRGAKIVDSRYDDPEMPLDRMLSDITEQGLLDRVNRIVGGVVPELKDIRVLTESGLPLVHVRYPDKSVPAALAGDGIYALVKLGLKLTAAPGELVLLEEPETHQHPGAMLQTAGAILAAVREGVQIVLSTHSLELIDSLLAESSDEDLEQLSLFRLSLKDGVLKSRRMPGSEVGFARGEIEQDLR